MKKIYWLTGDGPETRALTDLERLENDPRYCPPSRKELMAARYRDYLEQKKKPPGKSG